MTKKYSISYFVEQSEQQLVDEASTTVTYLGFSEKGVDKGVAKWVVVRITIASATTPVGVVTIEWATQVGDNSNIWNNRASLTYVS
jgi:hypothetical protein